MQPFIKRNRQMIRIVTLICCLIISEQQRTIAPSSPAPIEMKKLMPSLAKDQFKVMTESAEDNQQCQYNLLLGPRFF